MNRSFSPLFQIHGSCKRFSTTRLPSCSPPMASPPSSPSLPRSLSISLLIKTPKGGRGDPETSTTLRQPPAVASALSLPSSISIFLSFPLLHPLSPVFQFERWNHPNLPPIWLGTSQTTQFSTVLKTIVILLKNRDVQ